MGYPHGHAKVDRNDPRAFGVCDRCKFQFNHEILRWQFDWFGNQLRNTRFLVCPSCMDKPHEFTRPPRITADPVPILNARPEPYSLYEGSTPPNISVLQLVSGQPLPAPYVGPVTQKGISVFLTDDEGQPILSDSGNQLVPE